MTATNAFSVVLRASEERREVAATTRSFRINEIERAKPRVRRSRSR